MKSQFVASQVTLRVDLHAGADAVGFPLRPAQHARRRPAGSAMRCRRATTSRCCRRSSWPATSGASSCRTPAVLAAMAAILLALTRRVDPQERWRETRNARLAPPHPRPDPQGAAGGPEGSAQPRDMLFLPPVLQCLLFGYAATWTSNDVPYAVLDQDRSAASLGPLGQARRLRRLSSRRQPRRAPPTSPG